MWFNYLMVIFAVILSIPLLIVSLELLIALVNKSQMNFSPVFQGSYKILIPAHNESEIIGETLRDLMEGTKDAESIIVVADNCSDNTAEIARTLGVTVLERFDRDKRGKGYALDHGISYIKSQCVPNVLIILDSDCQITSNSLNILAHECMTKDRPIQALYLMRHGISASLKQRVAGFAWLVKNKIRPIAVNKLGLPVTLTGTGMAFPWHVIADINVAHGNIVEDMQLGIDCTLNGYPPLYCEHAVVYSDFPLQNSAEQTQRRRWEHGHLLTIIQQVPKLLKQAFLKKDLQLLGLALDLGVPPLGLLVLLTSCALILFAIFSYWTNNSISLTILMSCFLSFAVLLLATWWKFGRDYLTFRQICCIPLYVISKLSIYSSFIFKRQKVWVRTSRDTKEQE